MRGWQLDMVWAGGFVSGILGGWTRSGASSCKQKIDFRNQIYETHNMINKIKLNFEGKEVEFFFGLSFLGEFLKEEDTDLQGIFNSVESDSYTFIPNLMYKSYLHNSKRQGKKADLKHYQIADLIESSGYFKDGSESAKFVEAFLQSIIDSLPKDEAVEEDTCSRSGPIASFAALLLYLAARSKCLQLVVVVRALKYQQVRNMENS
jgi:hypothetical protein